jgi:hypothetical protein
MPIPLLTIAGTLACLFTPAPPAPPGACALDDRLVVDTCFRDTLTFANKWDYPWYIIVGDDGKKENTLGGDVDPGDTLHQYRTANCVTNHQGEHAVRFCDASLTNDTLRLSFQPELPAYAGSPTLLINKGRFRSEFHATYPQMIPGENLSWCATKQRLVLNRASYRPGDTVKGYVDIVFRETSVRGESSAETEFFFRGFFKTPLPNK